MITGSREWQEQLICSVRQRIRFGAGLVQIYTAEENRQVLQRLLPEAIISCYREYDEEDWIERDRVGRCHLYRTVD